jgi:hypothetical protein
MSGVCQFSNNASTTIAGGITSGSTSITLAVGTGALFPALSGSNYFIGTLVDGSGNIELVKVTARSSDTLTVVRGREGTTAIAFASGSKFECRVTAAGLMAKVDYGDSSFSIAQSQVTGLVAALAAIYQFPSGTKTVFYQAAAPTGWTQITTSSLNDTALRLVTGAGGGSHTSGQAFSAAVANGTVNTHALTQAELPNCSFPVTDPGHAHTIGKAAAGQAGGSFIAPGQVGTPDENTGNATTGISVSSGGSNTPHGHGWITTAIDINYINVILCAKN